MFRLRRLTAACAAAGLALTLASCSSDSSAPEAQGDGSWAPVTIDHALGTTTIDKKPERVASVAWGNHEVPLALGVVPVGMAKANFGDDDGDGVLPWVHDKLEDLGAQTPTLYDETDGIDFEAVADSDPDVILAAYSGLSQEDYDKLSDIAPVVAYPDSPWGTSWREMIELDSKAMGKEQEGKQLITDLEQQISDKAGEHPQVKGKSAMFMTADATDMSKFSVYTTHDPRAMFLEDLGLTTAPSVKDISDKTDKFFSEQSSEQADRFSDADVIVSYGDDKTLEALQKDTLLSKLPAVSRGALAMLPLDKPLGAAANPSPLAIPWVLDDYYELLDDAVARGQ